MKIIEKMIENARIIREVTGIRKINPDANLIETVKEVKDRIRSEKGFIGIDDQTRIELLKIKFTNGKDSMAEES